MATMLTCADSRAQIKLLLNQDFSNTFIIRMADEILQMIGTKIL